MAGALGRGRRRPPRAPARRRSSAAAPRDRRAQRAHDRRPASRSRTRRPYTLLAGGGDLASTRPSTLPADARRPAARRHRPRARARASRPLRWFGTGPHETYPDRKRGGLVGRWESTRHRPVRPVHPPAGERRPRRRPLARADRGADGPAASGSTSTSRARSRPPTMRAADLAAATHDVELVPRPETDRPSRRRPPRPRDGQLRPRHAPRVPASGPAPTAGRGPSATSAEPDAMPIDWSPDDPRAPPPQRADQLRPARPRERLARPSPFRARRSPPGRSYAPPRADRLRRLHEPRRRPGPARVPDDRAPATTGSRPWPSSTPTARPSSTCVYREHRDRRRASRPARATACPSTYVEADDEADTLEVALVDDPSGLEVDAPLHDLPRPPGRRPQRPRSATTAPTPSASTGAMSAVARPARRATGSSSS